MSAKRPTKHSRQLTDDLFDVLGVNRRRRLLTVLRSRSGTVTLSELTDDLSKTVGTREGAVGDELAVRLHHVDLPKLADAGVLEYDTADRLVTVEPSALRMALETTESALGAMRNAR